MHRFCVRRRWELFLIVGVPAIGRIAHQLTLFLFEVSYIYPGTSGPEGIYYGYGLGALAASSVVQAAILAFTYFCVRRLDRPFLVCMWHYVLVSQAATGLIVLVGAPLLLGDSDSIIRVSGLFVASDVLTLPILLWFARQASRFSLSHSFFLVLLGGLGGVGLPNISLPGSLWVWSVVWIPIVLVLRVLGAWLLANFEERGRVFRKRAVLALLALGVYGAVIEPFGVNLSSLALLLRLVALTVLILFLALVYAVRVRNQGLASGEELQRAEI